MFEDCDAQVNVVLGGNIQTDRIQRADSWLSEMTFVSMRWETKMVGPRPLLP